MAAEATPSSTASLQGFWPYHVLSGLLSLASLTASKLHRMDDAYTLLTRIFSLICSLAPLHQLLGTDPKKSLCYRPRESWRCHLNSVTHSWFVSLSLTIAVNFTLVPMKHKKFLSVILVSLTSRTASSDPPWSVLTDSHPEYPWIARSLFPQQSLCSPSKHEIIGMPME